MVIGLAADGDVGAARPRPRRRPAGGRRRLRGQGPVPAGRRDLRPARLDPDGQPARVPQRRRRRQRRRSTPSPAPAPDRPAGRWRARLVVDAALASAGCPAGGLARRLGGGRLALFLNSSRDRRARQPRRGASGPTLDGYVVLHTGPVLPDFRSTSGSAIGVDVDPRQDQRRPPPRSWSSATPTSPASPRARSPRSSGRSSDMAPSAALRGAALGLVPIARLAARRAGPAPRAGSAGVRWPHGGIVGRRACWCCVVVLWSGSRGAGREPTGRRPSTWMPLAGRSSARRAGARARLTEVEVRGDVTTAETRRLIESAIDTYDKSQDVLRQRAATPRPTSTCASPRRARPSSRWSRDRHDNIGMDAVARAIGRRGRRDRRLRRRRRHLDRRAAGRRSASTRWPRRSRSYDAVRRRRQPRPRHAS